MTLSENQAVHVQRSFDEMASRRSKTVLLEGWERSDEPVDRIVSIDAFEHFGSDRYSQFFSKANKSLGDNGIMLLHTIIRATLQERRRGNGSASRCGECTPCRCITP